MSLYLLAFILFGLLFVFIMLGIPIAFVMAGISIVLGYFLWGGMGSVEGFVFASYDQVTQFVFTAIPLYIFMAGILRYSDLVDGLYESFYRWFGGFKGGLAVGTTIISTIFSAMVGINSVATATLGVSARPSMLKRNYDSKLTSGIILAGGGLGILIPPSILMIIYSMVAQVSPGKMFMAGIIPGIMIAVIFIIYVLIVCWIDPSKGPALPKEERYTWKEKFVSLKAIILPLMVVFIVLFSIFMGIATPTEAASIGVVGSLISAAINKKLTWSNLKKMLKMTVGLSAMTFWLVIGAAAYAKIVTVSRIGDIIADFVNDLNVQPIVVLGIILVVFFILGMFVDPGAILFMTAPIFLPLIISFDYDLIWFGVIFILSSCMAYLTPPFGLSLFILKGVAPDIEMTELYVAIIPFVLLFILGIIIVIIFPEIVLWLPNRLI